ncbi:MAG TPA: response regulator [Planctomycetota bacterium]|nr:response regulator [Planctomycetota bacterium]
MRRKAGTILLIEDNPDDAELTLRAFEKNQMVNEVVVATDGQEALDYLFATGQHSKRDQNSLPRLVLLDLKLPKIGGLEVLRRMRSDDRTRHVPVVVLTTSNEEGDIRQSYTHGCNSYIRKPVDFGEFLEATRQLGLYWLDLNEPFPGNPGSEVQP